MILRAYIFHLRARNLSPATVKATGFHLHPHMLRHTFVDNWLRNGGAEVDLARLAGWTTTRMAERCAQHRADERAVTAHKSVAPFDSLT